MIDDFDKLMRDLRKQRLVVWTCIGIVAAAVLWMVVS